MINNNNKENSPKKARMDFVECLYWAIGGIDAAVEKYQNLINRTGENEHGEQIRKACYARLAILVSKKKLLQAYADVVKGGIVIESKEPETLH